MTGTVAWLALVNAVFTASAASLYMGLMIVVRYFLKPAWAQLTPDTVKGYFGLPILKATRFFRIMFLPYLISSVLLIFSGWGEPVAVVCAWVAAACYLVMALWFQFKMLPVNTRLLSGHVGSTQELHQLLARWQTLNELRVVVSILYWLASIGFLVASGHLWEGLS
ncbi:hypothetical protein [Arthrobacter psychrolactophilus]